MEALDAADPRQIGQYRLLRRLGAGGMGQVYLGRTAGGRTVAVKTVHREYAADHEFRVRFRQEVSAARRVGGRWTAPVLDADTEGERPWVATAYVAGPSLATAVREFGPLPGPAVRVLALGLAEALAAVHALGLVHRDVKPSNVLLALDGPRLIDFGITRSLDAATALTRTGFVIGSPGFLSPEQAQGLPSGPASDVFSLGAVLAYAATGIAPFGSDTGAPALLYRVVHEEPDLGRLGGQEPEFLELLTACLAKDPGRRPTPERLRELLAPASGPGAGPAANRLGGTGCPPRSPARSPAWPSNCWTWTPPALRPHRARRSPPARPTRSPARAAGRRPPLPATTQPARRGHRVPPAATSDRRSRGSRPRRPPPPRAAGPDSPARAPRPVSTRPPRPGLRRHGDDAPCSSPSCRSWPSRAWPAGLPTGGAPPATNTARLRPPPGRPQAPRPAPGRAAGRVRHRRSGARPPPPRP